ncbi:hypothetical protein B0H65DRAFT_569806 [Neurospora tetraspora]|uniref:2EXR domain-containing protein n=1 Tax=Neurospora tetraspora TaxID=94610 RepID=A0AAE0MVT9_9PEZI|nr:hypothetical protein B0H65DRAFT_569806 [Neurospora tetraspora]
MLKRLSKLFNMSTTTSTPESFSLFPLLPGELRTLIWKHAVDPYRVLRITLYQQDFPPITQFLGSSRYGPPWNVKVGCTPQLKEATRHVRNLMQVSREAYKDIMDYILPDRIYVTVDWDPPYLREGVTRGKYASKNAKSRMGEKVYKIPWNRRTERLCLEVVHLSWDDVERRRMGVMEEMPRGSDLPAPPVWVNEAGYEPFGDVEPDSESDPDESRDPSRPSAFYVPPADAIASVPVPDPDPDRDLDPRAHGEIYIPHSHAQALCQRHISLAPTFTHLNPVAYGSSNPLLMLCKILRVTNITIIDDSILNDNDPANRPAGPSPAWVDEHKVLHELGMAELGRLGAALGDLLEEESQQADGQQGASTGSTSTTQTQTQIQTPRTVLARELRTMTLTPSDLAKIRFFRVKDLNPPPQNIRRNAREAQRVGGEWGNGRSGTWVIAWGEQHAPSRREGEYGGFGSTRGWWSGPGAGPWGSGGGGGGGIGVGSYGRGGRDGRRYGRRDRQRDGGGMVLDVSPPVTSVSVGPWGSGSGSGSGMSGFEWL